MYIGWKENHTYTCIHKRTSAVSAFLAQFHIQGWETFCFYLWRKRKEASLKQDWCKEQADKERRESLGREGFKMQKKKNIYILLVAALHELREERCCSSESWMLISADSFCFSSITLISQHTGLVLCQWLEWWWLSACVGAVWIGFIVLGCLCNLDVHREATFSITLCSNAIKTLVYSLVCY